MTRGKSFKEIRFRLDISNTFFTIEVVEHLNKLHTKLGNALFLETLKAKMDGALSSLL